MPCHPEACSENLSSYHSNILRIIVFNRPNLTFKKLVKMCNNCWLGWLEVFVKLNSFPWHIDEDHLKFSSNSKTMHLKYLFSKTLIELHFELTYVIYLREKKCGNIALKKHAQKHTTCLKNLSSTFWTSNVLNLGSMISVLELTFL